MSERGQRWGVLPSYWSWQGQLTETSPETEDAILAAMGATGENPPRARRLKLPPDPCAVAPDRAWGWAVQLYAARSRDSWGIGDMADLRRLAQMVEKAGRRGPAAQPARRADPNPPLRGVPLLRLVAPLPQHDVPPHRGGRGRRAGRRRARALRAARPQAERRAPHRLRRGLPPQVQGARGDLQGRARPARPGAVGAQQGPGAARLRHLQRPRRGARPGVARAGPPSCAIQKATGSTPSAAASPTASPSTSGSSSTSTASWRARRARSASSPTCPSASPPTASTRGAGRTCSRPDMRVGAPPDEFFRDGQDWGLPPFDPWKLRRAHYEPFVEAIRSAATHAAGIRLDHVMGLFRLFWIPTGMRRRRRRVRALPRLRPARAARRTRAAAPRRSSSARTSAWSSRRCARRLRAARRAVVSPAVVRGPDARRVAARTRWPRSARTTCRRSPASGSCTEPDQRQHRLRQRLSDMTHAPDDTPPIEVAVDRLRGAGRVAIAHRAGLAGGCARASRSGPTCPAPPPSFPTGASPCRNRWRRSSSRRRAPHLASRCETAGRASGR